MSGTSDVPSDSESTEEYSLKRARMEPVDVPYHPDPADTLTPWETCLQAPRSPTHTPPFALSPAPAPHMSFVLAYRSAHWLVRGPGAAAAYDALMQLETDAESDAAKAILVGYTDGTHDTSAVAVSTAFYLWARQLDVARIECI